MHPIAFQLGRFPVHWYGVMMALGFMAGLWTASRRGVRDQLSPEKILDVGPWLIIGAIIGARALHVITYWREEFAGKPFIEVFMVQKGGLVYYGGLIGASMGCVLFTWFKKVPRWKMADVLAPSIALGYFFGRLGCLFNGCCFGQPCHLPWALRFPDHSPVWDRQLDLHLIGRDDAALPVHPTQIYDSLLNLGLYLALAWFYRRKAFDGQIFALYLIGYAVTRSIVEVFRGDYTSLHIHGGLTPAHLISIAIFITGAVLFAVLRRGAGAPAAKMEDGR